MRKVIMGVWEACWSLWNYRNKQLHSNNVLDDFQSMEDIDDQIRAEFLKEAPPQVPPQYAMYFIDRNLETVMTLSNYHRRAWMWTVRRVRQFCASRPSSQQQLITAYMGVAPVPTSTETTTLSSDTTHPLPPPFGTDGHNQPPPPPPTTSTRLISSRLSTHIQQNQPTITSFFAPLQTVQRPGPLPLDETVRDHTDDSGDSSGSHQRKRQVQSPFPPNWKKKQ